MDFRQFEREFLRLAFTTSVELSPPALAFVLGIPIREAEKHLQALVSQGVLELSSDDAGRLRYEMPDRPEQPLAPDHPALAGYDQVVTEYLRAPAGEPGVQPPRAMVVRRHLAPAPPAPPVTPGQAAASMFLNALVCPGVGSLVAGRTRVGFAQLTMFLIGLPLVVIAIGLPVMFAAWVWGIVTGAQLISEARE
jgi:hypothetical protein